MIGREAARRRRHTRPQPHSVHQRPRWSLGRSALRLTNGPQKSNTRLHPSPPCRSDRYTKKHTRSLRTRSRARSRMCVAADPEKSRVPSTQPSKKQLLKKIEKNNNRRCEDRKWVRLERTICLVVGVYQP